MQHDHAVVVGGSMAGLLTARVLSEHFARVTVLERDPVHDRPEARKGQPHARQTHVVLDPARQLIGRYFPELESALIAGGAFRVDACENVCWFNYGGYRKRVTAGFDGLTVTRPLLEQAVRAAVLAGDRIRLRDKVRVDGLLWNGGHVAGVRFTERGEEGAAEGTLSADLVIDTSGRGSTLSKWLQAGGYAAPEREEVKIDVHYTTAVFQRSGTHRTQPQLYFINGCPPEGRLLGVMVPVEGERWFVTIGGWHGAAAPTDMAGFLETVRSLPTPDIYDVVASSKALSDPVAFHYRSSRRFHYGRLRSFPNGLLALGDSVASFNPIYGQGMSAAALQIEALDAALRAPAVRPLWRRFLARQAQLVDAIWNIAVGEDFRFPETVGHKPPGTDLGNWYVELIHRAAQQDEVVARQVVAVLSMRAAPTTLMHPQILWRVLRARAARR